ncbi:putative quinol monooxygenase [Pedobacter africanus]|uniref:Quinol monooxygenase YgiN n=1 Tax=Pedobacter africanus TaxID=151894 RepID=A0A1W2DD13_9SPHI|nr:antibiotic biosynthesis monooxygenase family protein [Pedobacter africanus]SMC95397.1 Quinol monooxygenase YgiN [Pedobacter africanus]
MLVRLVKMHFYPEFTAEFQELFKTVQPRISAFEGCHSVQLLQDQNDPEVFFTISHWSSEAQLNVYRKSELFTSTWAQVKPNFKAKAEAWSLLGK